MNPTESLQTITPVDSLGRQTSFGVLASDSIATDTVEKSPDHFGVLLESPGTFKAEHKESGNDGLSWIFGGLLLLFVLICLKFKNNYHYMKAVLIDLTEVRSRHNAFDDTVKETSFLLMLNLLWICCGGVLIYQGVAYFSQAGELPGASLRVLPECNALGIALCIGVAAVYELLMLPIYYVVGRVFSERKATALWLKGFLAAQGLTSIFFFPVALLTLCYPEQMQLLLIIAAGCFVFGKIIFIYKGFRIFFTQISSWFLFLYYLCSLEIVPLIITFLASYYVCDMFIGK